ncbi:MAG: hypothetical protein R2746_05455 [Acidimicrobiales bacterium]|nr:hypothetical protein [Actinomycetota bacterium]
MTTIPPAVDGAAVVVFDPATAGALATAYDQLARDLDQLRIVESTTFDHACEQWRGRTAVWAARQRPDLVAHLQRAARLCEEAALAARAAVGRAAEAQLARNAAATVVRQQAEARAELGQARVT